MAYMYVSKVDKTETDVRNSHEYRQVDVPGYIRTKSSDSGNIQLTNLFLAQELVGGKQHRYGSTSQTAIGDKISSGGEATVWAADFSLSGRYLAVAGKDRFVRVFKVITTEAERIAQQQHDLQTGPIFKKLSAPVFLSRPYRKFKGHLGEILTLSWSKNDFLLSGSADKTVHLWHPSQSACLREFVHQKTVTSVTFHPTDDRYFLSGCFDGTIRLWNIPEISVVHSAIIRDVITAVTFTPDGKVAICGSFNGMCVFYDTTDLKERRRTHLQPLDSKSKTGPKITGLQVVLPSRSADTNHHPMLMITTNDSQVRVFDLTGQASLFKLGGGRIQSSQIHARFNDSGEYAISGSENDEVHKWYLREGKLGPRRQVPHERFHTNSEVVTNAVIAPGATREILSLSRDQIYDLCSSTSSHTSKSQETSFHKAQLSAPLDDHFTATKPTRNQLNVGRNLHRSGNIIVTTNTIGKVKVYRQNCAFRRGYCMPR